MTYKHICNPPFSHQYTAEVKDEWSCTSTPLYAFMTWTGKTLRCILLFLFLKYVIIHRDSNDNIFI